MDSHMVSAHFTAFMGAMGSCGVKGASITKWEGATGAPLI
jgi:hypothetical protein